MFGAFDPAGGLSRPAFLTFMSLAALGTLLTAAYLLLVVRRVCMGSAPQATSEARDAQETRETPETPSTRETPGEQDTQGAPGTPETREPQLAPAEPPAAPAPGSLQDVQGHEGQESREAQGIPGYEIQDVQGYELATWSPLVALTVLIGLWPAALLGLTDPAVQKLLAGGKA